uniref:Uncharacterized protein n=1 Tax=Oryza punctata TaxID=4537 RepID=A0A0E0LG90_ORYPU
MLAALARSATARRMVAPRRGFCSRSAGEMEMEKEILKWIEESEVTLQREIIEDIEKVKRMEHEDRDFLNRLLTSCGVPNGRFRDKLMWWCNVAGAFFATSAVGTWQAERVARSKHVDQLARN